MTAGVNSRRYDNTRRAARSVETRTAIVDAARRLLVERGYQATTVAAVASSADVHVDTVYELVGRKVDLLRHAIEFALSGTNDVVPAEQRPYVAEIRAATDPFTKIRIYARATREMQGRLAPLYLAVRDAAATEPDARRLWAELSERRAENMRAFVADLRAAGAAPGGSTADDAADTVWVTNSPEVFVMLTHDRGWSTTRYERWLVDTWRRLLLP